MNKTVILKVVGTYYYQAAEAYRLGLLHEGSQITLGADIDNEYDKYAVVVSIKSFKLGHISKEYSQKYQILLLQDNILNAKVSSLTFPKNKNALTLKISISYRDSKKRNQSEKFLEFPEGSGVYKIVIGEIGSYIGSTENFRRRANQHLSQLKNKDHTNNALQSAFDAAGEKGFKFMVIENCNVDKLVEKEKNQISFALRDGLYLFNKTLDGRGRFYSDSSGHSTISDTRFLENNLNEHHISVKGQIPEESEMKNTWSDSSKYVGDEKNGQQHGDGAYTWPDGSEYIGEWLNGEENGEGTYTTSDGNKYFGEWLDGQQHGHGTYTWPDGSEYIGEWLNGEENGQGVYTDVNGDVFDGSWKNGKFEIQESTPGRPLKKIVESADPEVEESQIKYDQNSKIDSDTGEYMKGGIVYVLKRNDNTKISKVGYINSEEFDPNAASGARSYLDDGWTVFSYIDLPAALMSSTDQSAQSLLRQGGHWLNPNVTGGSDRSVFLCDPRTAMKAVKNSWIEIRRHTLEQLSIPKEVIQYVDNLSPEKSIILALKTAEDYDLAKLGERSKVLKSLMDKLKSKEQQIIDLSKELEKAYAGYDYHGRYREIINEKDRLIEEKNKEILRRKEQVEHLDQLIFDISTNGDGVNEYKS